MITWNPSDMGSLLTLSNNNLTVTKGNSNAWTSVRATEGKSSGKWYWETRLDDSTLSSSGKRCGISLSNDTATVENWLGYFVDDGIMYNPQLGAISISTGNHPVTLLTSITGDFIGIYFDIDTKIITFVKNGQILGSHSFDYINGNTFFAGNNLAVSGAKITANFGATPFDLTTRNPQLWNQLLQEGYLPYDYVSSKSWLNNDDELVYGKATVRNMQKSGVAWWKMNDSSGMAFDSKSSNHGMEYNMEYLGKEGIKFNGSSYIQYNSQIFTRGEKSLYLEFRRENTQTLPLWQHPTTLNVYESVLMTDDYNSANMGMRFVLDENLGTHIAFSKGTTGEFNLIFYIPTELICDNDWHNILLTWNKNGQAYLFIDDFIIPYAVTNIIGNDNFNHLKNLRIGAGSYGTVPSTQFFQGQLRNVQIYNNAIDPLLNKLIVESIYPTETFHQNQTTYITVKGQINNLANIERKTGFRIKINEKEILNQEIITDYSFNIQIPIENFNIGKNILTVEADYTDEGHFVYVIYVEDKHNVQVVRRYDYSEKFSFDNGKSGILLEDGANLKQDYLGKDTIITTNYSNVLTTGRRTIDKIEISANEDSVENLDYIQDMQNKQSLGEGYVWEHNFDLGMVINNIVVGEKVE